MQSLIIKRDIGKTYKKIFAEFTQLLGQLSQSDWTRPATGTKWTVGEVLTHLSMQPKNLEDLIARLKSGKGRSWLPKLYADYASYSDVRAAAAKTDLKTIRKNINRTYQACLKLLDEIADDEWNKAVRTPRGTFTGRTLFTSFEKEWLVHSQQIMSALDKKGTSDDVKK